MRPPPKSRSFHTASDDTAETGYERIVTWDYAEAQSG
jgi:hypothetical protein